MRGRVGEQEGCASDLFFSSWSGGKDACLALYEAMREGRRPAFLMTMVEADGLSTRGHGIPLEVVREQARLLGIPLATFPTTFEGYGEAFDEAARGFKGRGVEVGVFGDIELEEHRVWIEEKCASLGIRALLPLWNRARSELARDLLEAGFRAMVVSARDGRLDRAYLGRMLDDGFFAELSDMGLDAFGEEGEYHTLVVDGPIFSSPLPIRAGGVRHEDGHWLLDVSLA